MDEAVWGLSHGDESIGDEGMATADQIFEGGGDGELVATAVWQFLQDQGIGEHEMLDYGYEQWESLDGYPGALVTVSHNDITALYAVVDIENGVKVVSRDDADGWRFLCSGL